MNKVLIVLISIVGFSSTIFSAQWVPAETAPIGILVDEVACAPMGDDGSGNSPYIEFTSGTSHYSYRYTNISSNIGEMPGRAKAILSMLLAAKSNGLSVYIYNTSGSDFTILKIGK
jgi:hypothetical protein